jgi:hypothetical protein|mmetsp:Transcript_43156/g.57095  ORF Transcript_43156/g.57095 Transcript_43156/m.57095 type:complete len:149 (+) Transcript_43156:52-498(+)
MRVSALIAASSLLFAAAAASDVLKGRSLHQTQGESKSNLYTITFKEGPNTNGGPEEFEGGNLIGLIIGFVCTGIFMIFASIEIILDEIARHASFKKKIVQAESELLTYVKYCDRTTVNKWLQEFEEKEKARGSKVDTEKERKELQEIN